MKAHPTDKVSLWFGVIFLIAALWWLLGSQIKVDLPTAGWFVAAGLILFGVLGLIGSLRPRRQVGPTSPAAPMEDWPPGQP